MSETIVVGKYYRYNDPHREDFNPIVRVVRTTLEEVCLGAGHYVHKILILSQIPDDYQGDRPIDDSCQVYDYALSSELDDGTPAPPHARVVCVARK